MSPRSATRRRHTWSPTWRPARRCSRTWRLPPGSTSAWRPRGSCPPSTSWTPPMSTRHCSWAAIAPTALRSRVRSRGVASWQARAREGYDLPHFTIDWDHKRVTCPEGKVSVSWRPARNTDGSPRICAQFSRSDCGACAARALCTQTRRPRRHVTFHPREQHEALDPGAGAHVRPRLAAAPRGPGRGGGNALAGRPRHRACAGAATSAWRRPAFSRPASPPRSTSRGSSTGSMAGLEPKRAPRASPPWLQPPELTDSIRCS